MGFLNVFVIKFFYRNERKKNESYYILFFYIIDRGKKLFDKIDYFRLLVYCSIYMW